MIANQTNQKEKIIKNPNIAMSYEEIAKVLGITEDEVKSAEKSAIRKLRHPRVGGKLKKYIGI